MAAVQYDNCLDGQSYLESPEMNPGLYDGTSSESSASSPLNSQVSHNLTPRTLSLTNKPQTFDSFYSANGYMSYPPFPMQYPIHGEGLAPVGLIPVELDIEGLYEDHDRRRKKSGSSEKSVSSHVHSVCQPPLKSTYIHTNHAIAPPSPKSSFTTSVSG